MENDDAGPNRLLEHSYDGIQEYDNPLPRWWVWIFWGTILFAVLYAIDPGGQLRGPGRIRDYERSMAEAAARFPKSTGMIDPTVLMAASRNPQTIAAGKAVFAANCTPCHGPDGGGIIGPNLTDDYWLHGGTLPEIYHTVYNGVLEKGMPNWGKMLKPEQVEAAAVYVYSLRGTHPANPKAPQGVKVAP